MGVFGSVSDGSRYGATVGLEIEFAAEGIIAVGDKLEESNVEGVGGSSVCQICPIVCGTRLSAGSPSGAGLIAGCDAGCERSSAAELVAADGKVRSLVNS